MHIERAFSSLLLPSIVAAVGFFSTPVFAVVITDIDRAMEVAAGSWPGQAEVESSRSASSPSEAKPRVNGKRHMQGAADPDSGASEFARLLLDAERLDDQSESLLDYFGIAPDSPIQAQVAISASTSRLDLDGDRFATMRQLNAMLMANVPEPAEVVLFGLGIVLLLLGIARRRRKKGP